MKEAYKNKLYSIAEGIANYLEKEYGEKATYSFEQKFYWLTSSPLKGIHSAVWDEICKVYALLIEDKFSLDSRIQEVRNFGNQKTDIYFFEPYNFIFEFDEKQHFNKYRLLTLSYSKKYACFDFDEYRELCYKYDSKPNKSRFSTLQGCDPLFPPLLDGEAQDNRTRQRAFRDFLKDILSPLFGLHPTVRISFEKANKKKTDFNDADIRQIIDYINQHKYLGEAFIKNLFIQTLYCYE